ncbi:MAG: DUF2264 domain-containing protein [Bacteroidetes bacterium]|nr:DUF2264 domain-containing protein [Bacteroidota bacterium]MBS1974668.1 DUF2264 domain-containing protein [Bacteroidota bacterium]
MRHRVKIIFGIAVLLCSMCHAQQKRMYAANAGLMERAYLVNAMLKIADPVLQALSKNELKQKMPVEAKNTDRQNYSCLEAFGRLLSGMAPWLELGADSSTEGKLRARYVQLARVCLHNATGPSMPDFMNFNKGSQPLVDAAFLAQALIRAPGQLWAPLDKATKQNIINALKSSRAIRPGQNNWLLFSAMVEAALLQFDGQCDISRINYAMHMHELWYKGDGTYGDGENFHWDYYNSFVIQPMLIELLNVMQEHDTSAAIKNLLQTVLKRAKRYAAIQERMVSPEGTYPPIGRSLAYRFGAFQLLSKIALMHQLPQTIKPQQARAALFAVIKKQIEMPGTFDKKGWLQIGMAGHQPGIGEEYISTGSLYLCTEAFLILGLPAPDDFWNKKDEDWTSKKIWKGINVPADHAED